MRTAIIVMLAIALSGLAIASGVEVQDPVLTLSGHYRSRDGRVSEHKFPVEIKLLADGKFTATFQSWIEERLSNGTSHLDYFTDTFSGNWKLKGQTIYVTVLKGNVFPKVSFPEINGVKINVTKKNS